MNDIDLTDAPARPPARDTAEIAYDVATVLALLVGGFVVPVAGWIAGVVLLWNGPRFGTGSRWIGTLAWPVAAVIAVVLLATLPWSSTALWVGALVLAVTLVVVHVLLSRAAAGRR